MAKFIVVLLEFNLPSGGMGSNFMGFTPISQVTVVSPYENRYRGSSEQVRPVIESIYDSQEFIVKALIVLFSR
jgi:hypothetical protein